MLTLSASTTVSGRFLFNVSGSRTAVAAPKIPLIPKTKNGKLVEFNESPIERISGATIAPTLAIIEHVPIPLFLTDVGNNSDEYK